MAERSHARSVGRHRKGSWLSARYYLTCWIWMRLPQVSSKTATITWSISVGFVVNFTPRAVSFSYSALMSLTPKEFAGMPCSKILFWYVLATGWFRTEGDFGVRQPITAPLNSGVEARNLELRSPPKTLASFWFWLLRFVAFCVGFILSLAFDGLLFVLKHP